jgi:O-antigen/teichoic acid export membrane protein
VVLLSVAILIPGTPWLLEAWVGDEVRAPGLELRLALGCYVVVMALSATVAAYLNAMGLLRLQAALGVVMAVSNVVLSVLFVKSMGVQGPVWATVVTQGGLVLVPCTWVAITHVRRMGSR